MANISNTEAERKGKIQGVKIALDRELLKYKESRKIEHFYELLGGIIKANEEENSVPENVEKVKEILAEISLDYGMRTDAREAIVQYIDSMNRSVDKLRHTSADRKMLAEEEAEIEDILILFFANGIIDGKYLKENDFNQTVTDTRLFIALEKGKISSAKVVDMMNARFDTSKDDRYDRVLKGYNYFKDSKKNSEKRKAGKYLQLIPEVDALKLYFEGKLKDEDIIRRKVSKESILSLSAEEIINLTGRNVWRSLPRISSDEFLNLYMQKFSGSDLIALANKKMVNPESIITLAANNAAKELDAEKAIKPQEILDFYSGKRLLELKKAGKINSRFAELLNQNVLSTLSEEDRKQYYAKVIKDLEKEVKSDAIKTAEYALELYEVSVLSGDALKDNIIGFEDSLLSLAKSKRKLDVINKLYNEGIISNELLREIYTEDEIMQKYGEGQLGIRAMTALEDGDAAIYFCDNNEDGKVDSKAILTLYATYDSISIEDLVELLKDNVEAEEIYNNLPRENLSADKVKELFLNYLISQDELGKLRDEQIISREQYDSFSSALSKSEFYRKLRTQKNVSATAIPEKTGKYVERGPVINIGATKKDKITLTTRKAALKELGGEVETSTLRGENGLDGYTIVGFEEDGLVVFENFEQGNNASFVTTYQQAAYFLENQKIASSVFAESEEKVNYTGTKTDLRDTENVRRRLHSKHWLKNIVSSMCELSENARNRLKPKGKYTAKAKALMEKVSEEYERNNKDDR